MNPFDYSEPQPEKPKSRKKPLVATRTCNVEFETVVVELVKGCEVHGLKRQERDYLKFHKFAK